MENALYKQARWTLDNIINELSSSKVYDTGTGWFIMNGNREYRITVLGGDITLTKTEGNFIHGEYEFGYGTLPNVKEAFEALEAVAI